MADDLLSFSNINLFGVKMEDLQIVDPDDPWQAKLASAPDENVSPISGKTRVNGEEPQPGDFVLLWSQKLAAENGLYRIPNGGGEWPRIPLEPGDFVINAGDLTRKWKFGGENSFVVDDPRRRSVRGKRQGGNRQLEEQLMTDGPMFARIYGFSYEGTYYDLPRPVLFLVHGEGQLVTEEAVRPPTLPHRARAPRDTDLTGLAALSFDFADELKVWSYDSADYTIRMDVDTGMFEQVLLDAVLGSGLDATGMNARGMNARGMNARGMNARGMNARGMNARGGGNSD